MRHSCFTVSGKPFFSLGGQVHNSSSYPIGGIGEGKAGEDAERSFQSVRAIGGNTIGSPCLLGAFEPGGGRV